MDIDVLEIGYVSWGVAVRGADWWQSQMDLLLKSAERCGVQLLAFGVSPGKIRVVARHDREALRNHQRAIKVGVRHLAKRLGVDGLRWTLTETHERTDTGIRDIVDWAHHYCEGTPWSSQWDYNDLRHHRFVPDRSFWSGTSVIPTVATHSEGPPTLGRLLSVSGLSQGLSDGHPKSFPLFVALAKRRGYATTDLAHALCLTNRRIRQLASGPTPTMKTARRLIHTPFRVRM